MSRLSSHHFWFSAGENVPSSCLLVTKSRPPSGGGLRIILARWDFRNGLALPFFLSPPEGGLGSFPFFRGRNSLGKVRVSPSEFRVSPESLPRPLGTRELAAWGHSGLTRGSLGTRDGWDFTSLTRFRTRLDVHKRVCTKRHIVL